MADVYTADNWDLDFYKPEDLLGRDPDAQWVDRQSAIAANEAGREFFKQTGIRVGVNLNEPAGPNGEGTRRGTRSASNNPGVKGSQHLHGKAFDFQIQGLDDEKKAQFLGTLRKHGFGGFGFYSQEHGGHLHADMGPMRTWNKGGIPLWAASSLRDDKELNSGPKVSYEVSTAMNSMADTFKFPRRLAWALAHAESTYNPTETVSTSSAKGLYQMTDGNWDYLLKKYAHNHPEIEHWDRFNPQHNALMMGHSLQENAEGFKKRFGRDPQEADIYGMHFLGQAGFARFMKASADDAEAPAYTGASSAAVEANHSVFFDKKGRARSFQEVYSWMNKKATYAPGYDAQDVKAYAAAAKSMVETSSALNDTYKKAWLNSNGMPTPELAKAQADLEAAKRKNELNTNHPVPPTSDPGHRKLTDSDIFTPPPVTTVNTAQAEEERIKHREETAPLMGTLVKDAFRDQHILSWATAGMPFAQPDPNYVITPEVAKQLTKDVDPTYWPMILDSYSAEQAQKAREDAIAFQQGAQRLDEAGWTGFGLRMGAMATDPLQWVAAIGGGAALEAGIAGTRLAVGSPRVASALSAAAANVAAIGAVQASGDPRIGSSDYVYGGLLGFGIGAAIGRGASNAEKARFAELTLAAAAERKRVAARNAQEAISGIGDSTGAARNLDAPHTAANISENFAKLADDDVPKSGGSNRFTFGSAEVSMRSKNPAERVVAESLGEFAIGHKNHSAVPFAASEKARAIEEANFHQVAPVYLDSYKSWATDEGIGRLGQAAGKRYGDFSEQVARYIRETDQAVASQYAEQVRTAGDAIRKVQKDLIELAQKPGKRMGDDTYRPMKGADHTDYNANYLMRMWDNEKLRELGPAKLRMLLRGSLRDAQPTLDKKYLDRLVNGAAESMMNRAHGLSDMFERAMMGYDEDALRAVLRQGGNLSEEEMQDTIKALTKPKTADAGSSSRMKHRMRLNEKFKTTIEGQTHSLEDYLINDAMALFQAYNRQMSARIGLAQTRILNPKTGEVLADGITSDADFNRLMKDVAARGQAAGLTARQIAAGGERLQFMYDYMTGRLPMPDNAWVDGLRLLRKYNYVRLMNQVGFAQIPEAATTVGAMGWRASMEHMPSLRRIVGMTGDEIKRHGLDDEFEYLMGDHSSSWMRSSLISRMDDEATNSYRNWERGRTIDKIEAGLENAGRVVSKASGMAGITDTLKGWSARVVGQKFINIAAEAKRGPDGRVILSEGMRRRMSALGFDSERMTKYKYKNPDHHAVDMVKWREQYNTAVDLKKKATQAVMSPEDKTLYEALKIRLDTFAKNADTLPESRLGEIEGVTKQMDELLEKNGYTPPKPPRKDTGGPPMIEGEATMLDRIVNQINQHATTVEGTFNKKKFKTMNFNNWTDLEARENFILGIRRASNRYVQENDVGQMHRWMSHPLGQMMLQFRQFTMVAWAKQFLHNTHLAFGNGVSRENAAAMVNFMLTSMVMGGAAYSIQQKLASIGRSDADTWFEERTKGDPKKVMFDYQPLVTAAMQRAGWSSIIPMVVDSSQVGYMLAGDPLFNARSTGQVTNIWLGSPTTGLVDQVARVPRIARDTISGKRSFAQTDARAIASLAAFQNMYGVQQAISYLISDLPEKPRR